MSAREVLLHGIIGACWTMGVFWFGVFTGLRNRR